MKRIANATSVQTILYTLNPKTFVKIVDYKSYHDVCTLENGEVKFFGKNSGLIGYEYSKEKASEVQKIHTEIVDGEAVIVFSICESEDKY